MFALHPAILVLCFIVLTTTIVNAALSYLLLHFIPVFLFILMIPLFKKRFVTMLLRMRWFWLSIFLLYTLLDHGGAAFQVTSWLSLSYAGFIEGLTRCLSLMLVIAYFTFLSLQLDREAWQTAIMILTWPLKYLGFSPERLSLRISMTFEAIVKIQDRYAQLKPDKTSLSIKRRLVHMGRSVRNLLNDIDEHYDATPVTINYERPILWQWLVPISLFGFLWLLLQLVNRLMVF